MNKLKTILILLNVALLLSTCSNVHFSALIEAESFQQKGGWVLDNQAMTQMGSPYLMAHGLGIPVADAVTGVDIPQGGTYHVWVRTRDWTRTFGATASPGRFELLFDGVPADSVFGTHSADWHWQNGGTVRLQAGHVSLALHDLTSFNGRCDAIYLTSDANELPPDTRPSPSPVMHSGYDLVVVGGGIAGCCAAITAARLGCKVALVQNRPVLGGNNSSEVRVGLSGLINQQPYPNLGNLIDEIGSVGHWTEWEAKQNPETTRSKQIFAILAQSKAPVAHNAAPAAFYDDTRKERLVRAEPNISLFLKIQVDKAECHGDTIVAAGGTDIVSGAKHLFHGTIFADCTGDGDLGFLAGADYRMGRESMAETNEPRAPETADSMVMGTSVQWYAEKTDTLSPFPVCPWAVTFDESTAQQGLHGDWNWETGLNRNQITEIERIRDYALRAVFGNWDFLKNRSRNKAEYADKQLTWVAFIGGKRESRRLLGDVILSELDLINQTPYEDASFTTTWGVDLHYPKDLPGFEGEAFLARSDVQHYPPYAVPYRCLYSRNIANLFMAGRDISATHIALGTIRVMRTGGMMGEVVGMAASICKAHNSGPRSVYQKYLPELKLLMKKGVGKSGFDDRLVNPK